MYVKMMVHWIADQSLHTISFLQNFVKLYSVHFFIRMFPTSPASLGISVALKCNRWESQSAAFIFYNAVTVLFDNIAPRLPSTTEATVWEDKRLHLQYSTA